VIAGVEQHVEEQEVRFDGAGRDQDVLGIAAGVGLGDQAAQLVRARGLAVSQPELEQAVERGLALAVRQPPG
jgi:hypothetical protein